VRVNNERANEHLGLARGLSGSEAGEMRMSKVLAEVESRSKPGKRYQIILAKDNTVYCNCWQWKKKRNCSHLEYYLAQTATNAHHVNNDDLRIAIDTAITELS